MDKHKFLRKVLLILTTIQSALSDPVLVLPAAGNCGSDTILTCRNVQGNQLGFTVEKKDLCINSNTTNATKYSCTKKGSLFNVTIHNTDISDEGNYSCSEGFGTSNYQFLKIECKASAAVKTVTKAKKVFISVDKLYPSPVAFTVSVTKQRSADKVQGSKKCSESRNYLNYYKCEWISKNSLADGSYRYSLNVTTITQAEPLEGSFTIVSPLPPAISNVVTLNDKREVINGKEGVMLTIECVSNGGYPAPTATWYKDSISSINNLTSTLTDTLQSDGTFSVTIKHSFIPKGSDDRGKLICRSYYPEADSAYEGSENKTVILYLTLKPSQPKATQTAVVSAGGFVEVSCRTTGCRPAANISWLYQGYTTKGKVNATLNAAKETYTVDSFFRRQVTAADNGHNVQCVITHPALVNQAEGIASVNLNVRFKPLTATITGNRNIIANGKKTLTLVCTSGSSNPISDITWRINSVITPSNGNLSDQSGEYGGMKRRQILKLAPTRDNDNDSISCQAYNNAGTSEMSEVTLDLKYRPLIENMPEIIVVEGNSSVLTCVASSKPASTFRWFREQSTFLDQGNGTLGNNKFSYTINNVRRTDAATYRCNANNRVELEDNKNVRLKVYYPPDVTAIADNTTVKATTASILCNAKGVPSTNYMYGKWIQTWAGYNVPVSEKPESERLVLKNLTYEHSGVYTCSASNGIKVFGTNKEFMEGSVLLVVKSFPVITNVSEKTPAKFKENASLEVYYYSNVAGSEVKIYRNVNGSKQERIIYNASETRVEVSLPVFAHTVRTRGTKAQILIQILSQDDFGSYDVVVANEIGSSTRSFEIVPKGPPSMPNNLTVDSIQYNKAHLSWIRGYHGGLAQTFVIQLSTDLNIWNNITVYGGLNKSLEPISEVLPGLHDSTTYYIRMFAFNNEGSSPFTEILNYTTPSVPEEDKPSVLGAVIGATAGGISALIIISVVFVVLKRRGVFAKGKPTSLDDKNDRKPVHVDEDDYGMQDNPMYVSAGPRNQIQSAGGSGIVDGAVYSSVDKKRIVVDSRKNDVYAEVDKSNKTKTKKALTDNEHATSVKPKGKKEKKEKSKQDLMKIKKGKKVMQEGDLYENATTTEMKGIMAKQNKNDETIYENPEPSKPAEKKNVNKDGLIYADLTFNDQPKGQKKLVIHGLDSMTEYVKVDFTKKADPLPDSDDENNSPKN